MYGPAQHAVVRRLLDLLNSDDQVHVMPVSVLAKRLGVSVFYLQHLVRRELGTSCTALQRTTGVSRATRLLREHPEETIGQIADRLGYEPRTMHRQMIMLPTQM